MSISDKELSKLGEAAGVDFVGLRIKYSQGQQNCALSGNTQSRDDGKGAKAEENLSKYKICPSCHGLGIVKSIYNHMTLEKSCDECDGDSIVLLDAVQNEIRKHSTS
eukprot:gene31450-38015_t